MKVPFKVVPLPPGTPLPTNEFFHTDSWKGGFDVSDAPEDSAPGQSFDMQDVEVTQDDRLIRAPGVSLTETLEHTPSQVLLHAGSQYASALVFLAAPFIGVKQDSVTSWFNAGIGSSPFGYTNYAGFLLLTNGSKGIYVRKPNKLAIELIPGSPAGFALASFAGRVVVGGAQIDGKLDFMGVSWSDSTSDYAGWDPNQGAGGQILIGSMLRADRIQGFAALGFETLAVINRRSIWQGVPTGDEFQPIRFSPRLEDVGCSHAQTICPTEFGVLFLSDDGVRLFTGSDAPVVSNQINRVLGAIVESDHWTACYDPARKRYYLHSPTATWVLDLLRHRWFKWSGQFLGSAFFPAQSSQITWGEAIGTWGSQTLAWWQLLPQESGGQMYFVKTTELGTEDPSTYSILGGGSLDPRWFDRIQVGENQDQLMIGLGARFTYEADAASQIELWLPDKPDGNYEAVRTATLPVPTAFTKRAWVPFIHTGRGIGLGLRITAGSPQIRKASVEFQRTGMLFEQPGDETTPVETLSDAMLKPRVIWTEGIGLGEGSLVELVGGSVGRYNNNSSIDYYAGPQPTEFLLSSGYKNGSLSWEYVPTGGPDGGGYLLSKAGEPASNGHWNFIGMRSDSPGEAGGVVIKLNLFGKTIPPYGLNFAAFAAQAPSTTFDPDPPVSGIVAKQSATNHIVLSIDQDYKIVARRVSGSDPTLWPVVKSSTIKVATTGWFTIEAGVFLSTFAAATDQIDVPTGYIFARYHELGDVLGIDAFRGVGVVASNGAVAGIVWGADVRSLTGTNQAIEGIGYGSVVAYDNGGTIKRYLYEARVGTLLPTRNGTTIQSTVFHGSVDRWRNVAWFPPSFGSSYIFPIGRVSIGIADWDNPGLLGFFSTTYVETNNYNTLAGTNRDLYGIGSPRLDAREILAVCVQALTSSYQIIGLGPVEAGHHTRLTLNDFIDTSHGGNAKLVLVSGVAEQLGSTFEAEFLGFEYILTADDILLLEDDPETSAKFLPAKIAQLLIGIQSVIPIGQTQNQLMVSQMALEYVFRTRQIIDTEHAPFPPIASFAAVVGVNPWDYTFQDTSQDIDGSIVSRMLDFGDGNPPVSVTLAGIVNHSYAINGTVHPTITVTDNDGLTATKSLTLVIPNRAPVANFSFAADPGDITGQTVDFTDLSSDPDGTVVSRDWDFGDGSPHSTATNPTHVYATAGDRVVTLVVTDNNGATNSFNAHVVTPIITGGGDCTLSASALANGAWIQGDDYNGGNPPLPAYANTTSLDLYLRALGTFREAYDFCHDTINDGVSHFLDTTKTFNGHPTYGMNFGKPAATTYRGGGWTTIPTDDGDPTETYYGASPSGPRVYWIRRIWEADAGVMSQAGVVGGSTGVGLIVLQASGTFNLIRVQFFNRAGRIYVEVRHKIVQDGADQTDQFDVCAETIFVGRGDALFGEFITKLEIDNTAHTLRIKVWAGDACSLTGVSPIFDQTVAAFGTTTHPTVFFGNGTDSFNGQQFTPAGALKQLNCALWEQQDEDLTGNTNPYGVSLT